VNSIRGMAVGAAVCLAATVASGPAARATTPAATSANSVTVGVAGAAPSNASFTGGPITGSADASGNLAPQSCSDPSCEQIGIILEGPAWTRGEISLSITVDFSAPDGNPDGTTGLDLWLESGSGTVLGSSTAGSSPAQVAVSGVSPGDYTLEVTGEAGANNETYSGRVTATVPATTAPATPDAAAVTGVLPPAPASGLKGTNEDAEPGIAVDGHGTFWIASDIEPYAAHDVRALEALSGTDVWKSTDGGRTWTWVAAPFNDASSSRPGLGGEDTDIAVAPIKNANGFYNIYVASLWVGSTNVAISQDGGATWTVVPVNGEPVQDRPWLAASGSCVFYLSYHAIAPYDTVVDKFDLCSPADQAVGSAVDPTQTTLFAGNILPTASNRFGKQVVDNSPTSPHFGRIYVPMEGCATPSIAGEVPEEGVGCAGTPEIFVGYSDNGTTYTDSIVAPVATGKLFIWPATVATDSAGNVYVGWFDDQHSYLAVSRDGGATWSKPVQVNAAPALSSVYPTVAASAPGHVVVAFYGSTRAGDADDAAVMGVPNTYAAAPWQLYLATSDDYGATWAQQTVTPTIHTGVLCYNGSGCGQYPGDRNLLDDFGVAISPTTGQPVVAFTDDQPGGVQGLTHTDFATLGASPPPQAPELPYPAGAVLLLGGAGLLAARNRRRSARPA
jgi:hypothetical protein